jgi:hypothetical protein
MIHSSGETGGTVTHHAFNTVGLGGVVQRIATQRISDYSSMQKLIESLGDAETRLTVW